MRCAFISFDRRHQLITLRRSLRTTWISTPSLGSRTTSRPGLVPSSSFLTTEPSSTPSQPISCTSTASVSTTTRVRSPLGSHEGTKLTLRRCRKLQAVLRYQVGARQEPEARVRGPAAVPCPSPSLHRPLALFVLPPPPSHPSHPKRTRRQRQPRRPGSVQDQGPREAPRARTARGGRYRQVQVPGSRQDLAAFVAALRGLVWVHQGQADPQGRQH